jgi:hypothetical protein
VISDQHFGLSSDSEIFHDNFEKFYKDIFFPTLLERKIKKVYHLGDVFHQRKKTNTSTLKKAREYFFDPLAKHGIDISIIIGNHDAYFKESNDVNSPSLTLDSYDNVKVYSECAEEDNIALLPWINKSNAQECFNFIKNTKCNILFGHLELKGFKFDKNRTAEHGMSPKYFNRFDKVLSGHYHTRSKKDNIEYIGAPTQHTWIDDNDKKGFYIFDTKSTEMEYIENPHNLYYSFKYKEDLNFDKIVENSTNRFVKVFTDEIKDQKKYNELISRVNEVAHDIKNSDAKMYLLDEENVENIKYEDTADIIKKYILDLDDIDNKAVYDTMMEFYNEALTN